MWYIKNKDNNIIINLNLLIIKLVSQSFALLKAGRAELI